MSATDHISTVEKCYIAYYGRTGDVAGIAYWATRLDQVNGDLTEIIDAFANSSESQSLYGGLGDTSKINTIYQQVFGRNADPGGLAYYTDALSSGRMSQGSIALDILNGAQGSDLQNIENQVQWAMYTLDMGLFNSYVDHYGNTTTDDYGSSTGTSGQLNTGSSVNGNIETGRDTDWFRVSLTGNTTYTIDLEGSPTNAGTLSDTYLKGIFDSNGSLISGTSDDDGGVGVNSQLEFTPIASGYYYISAGAFSTNTGTYELSIDNGTGSDNQPPDNQDVLFAISNATYSETGDLDAIVNREFGEGYVLADWLDLENAYQEFGFDYVNALFEDHSNLIVTYNGEGFWDNSSRHYYVHDSDGTLASYFLSHDNIEDHEFDLGSWYGLDMPLLAVKEEYSVVSESGGSVSDDVGPDSISTNGSIRVGQTVTGELESVGDQDWFRIDLEEGEQYMFYQTGEIDSFIYLMDDNGNEIDHNDDGGESLDSLLYFTPDESGAYYIVAGSYMNGDVGNYELYAANSPTMITYADVELIGHAWWEFELDENLEQLLPETLQQVNPSDYYGPNELVNIEMGFYPENNALAPNDPGAVRNEYFGPHDGAEADIMSSYYISWDGLLSGLEYAKSIVEDPPDYNLYTFNCTDAIYEVAEAAMLDIETAPTIDILGGGFWSAIISHPSELWVS